jgi:hypothetical protein
MAKIVGYRQGQAGGGCLVTVVSKDGNELVLLPATINPKAEVRHSPDGFQWGYSGSGPTELARAILVHFYRDDDRVRHPACYRAFLDAFLSKIAVDQFELKEIEIREWFERWMMTSSVVKGWLTGRGQ